LNLFVEKELQMSGASAQKKPPEKAVSQGGKGHHAIPGAIGRVTIVKRCFRARRWMAPSTGISKRTVRVHANGKALRGPQERSAGVSFPDADPSTWIGIWFFPYSR
jgi:hypothetical protein